MEEGVPQGGDLIEEVEERFLGGGEAAPRCASWTTTSWWPSMGER